MLKKIILLGVALNVIFMVSGCQSIGEQITETQVLECDHVDSITIDVSSADVEVIADDRDDILVEFETYKNGHMLRTKEGSKTVIETYNKSRMFFNMGFNTNYRLTVYVPKGYDKDMNFNLSSGSVTMNDMELQDIDIDLSSGDIDFENVDAKDVKLNLSSGAVDFDNVSTDFLRVDMLSGKVNLQEFTGAINGDSSSGKFTVSYKDEMDDLDFEASSGTIKVDYSEVTVDGTFYLSKSSGDIDVRIELDDYRSDRDGDRIQGVSGSEKHEINLHISSGNIIIK